MKSSMMTLEQVASAVQGQIVHAGVQQAMHGVSIDTRTDCANTLFVALKGDRFDGHDFVDQAQQAGALGVMIERDVQTHGKLPAVKVADTYLALKQLSAWWRSEFSIPVVGITGSVGKTSVKEMVGAIFSELGNGVITKGNLNNQIGVPLTLMRLSRSDEFAVIEMGMNHAGEIARLTRISKPTIALVNNAAAAHLEGLGSVEAVAHAKGEIFEGLNEDGVAIINLDDDYADLWLKKVASKRIVSFSLDHQADVTANVLQANQYQVIQVNGFGKQFNVTLHALGTHNVRNALAAIAICLAANIKVSTIQSGLESYRPVAGRLCPKRYGNVRLIDDSYNANPASVRAAIDVLSQFENSTLILGDMGELGEGAEQQHQHIGEYAARQGVDQLLVCGEFAQQVLSSYSAVTTTQVSTHSQLKSQSFATQQDLISSLNLKQIGSTVLVKGSRFMQMEKSLHKLEQQLQQEQTTMQSVC